jgi:serine/threonine protein kinase/Tol biopolymer transport system component
MTLTAGSRVGPYEILALLGSGGMGEVYRARDPRLGREVAIKVLPSRFSADPERLHRFEQEARAAAALNHPNMLAVFDVGTENGTPYIVSELLEGATLRTRLTQAPPRSGDKRGDSNTGVSSTGSAVGVIAIRKAVDYAAQIARGLAAAHDRGIVHRDLKPENVFITSDGHVKILDFGLAKLTQPDAVLAGASDGQTRTMDTSPGAVLGTIGYMAPEQVRGQTVDHRADVFAFGAILYEMLSAQRAFAGATAADTMSAILDRDPLDVPLSERHIPPGLVRIVDRCLEKTPAARFQSTRDLAFALDAFSSHDEEGSSPSRETGRRGLVLDPRLAWVAAIVVATVLAVAAATYFRSAAADVQVFRSTIIAPPNTSFPFNAPAIAPAMLALSPDGRRLAFIARASDGRVQLWVRPLDGISAQPLPGTEGASAPFWSPDSKALGFFADGKLKKIDPSGGLPFVLCDAPPAVPQGPGGGGTWNRDGVIVFASTRVGHLQRVSAAGGDPSPVTMMDAGKGEFAHLWPSFLPDGRHFTYFATGSKERGLFDPAGVYAGSLDSTERKPLIPSGSNTRYAQGFLAFMRGSTLMVQPFDAARLSLTGEAVPIADRVFTGTLESGAFSLSDTGVLAYETGDSGGFRTQLTWVDRNGKEVGTLGDRDDYRQVRLSPDGLRAAVTIPDPATMTTDIWILDVERNVRTRFTSDPADDFGAAWSPDATRLAFTRLTTRTDIYQKTSSGAGVEEVLLPAGTFNSSPNAWSSDGRFFSYTATNTTTGSDLWILPLSGDRKPFPLAQTNFIESDGQFSADGRWVAYTSDESGRQEVYVIPFPGPGGKWPISTAGGSIPRWRRDGAELFYASSDDKLMVATVRGRGAAFEVDTVRSLFELRSPRIGTARGPVVPYDATADGQRFLVNRMVEQTPAASSITLVVNWPALLKK